MIVGKTKVLRSNHHPSVDKNVCKAIMKLSAFKQKASTTKQKIDFRKYKKQRNLVNKSKEVYKECRLQKFLLQMLNHSFRLVSYFFHMLAVNCISKPTGIVVYFFFTKNVQVL